MKLYVFLPVLILILLVSCTDFEDENDANFVIASWNVQNLFDGNEDGTEYSEYSASSGWKRSYYLERLKNVGLVLESNVLRKISVLVLNEVENETVVEDILNLGPMKRRDFRYYVCAGEEGGAIKTAVLSRNPIEWAKIHSSGTGRPFIEVCLLNNGVRIIVFALHAKSNKGSDEENTAIRSDLGNALEEVACEVMAVYPQSLVIIAGDFNEDFYDGNVIADPYKWKCFWTDFDREYGRPGSYAYDSRWFCYDNIVSNRDYVNAGAVCTDIVLDGNGYPFTWRRNTLSGISDHLPVWAEFDISHPSAL